MAFYGLINERGAKVHRECQGLIPLPNSLVFRQKRFYQPSHSSEEIVQFASAGLPRAPAVQDVYPQNWPIPSN